MTIEEDLPSDGDLNFVLQDLEVPGPAPIPLHRLRVLPLVVSFLLEIVPALHVRCVLPGPMHLGGIAALASATCSDSLCSEAPHRDLLERRRRPAKTVFADAATPST